MLAPGVDRPQIERVACTAASEPLETKAKAKSARSQQPGASFKLRDALILIVRIQRNDVHRIVGARCRQ